MAKFRGDVYTEFHPDQNLPGCMMPDGGECCAGHAAVVDDWHKQRREIERLREVCLIAEDVVWYDWSNNDSDAVRTMEQLRLALGSALEESKTAPPWKSLKRRRLIRQTKRKKSS